MHPLWEERPLLYTVCLYVIQDNFTAKYNSNKLDYGKGAFSSIRSDLRETNW